MDIQFTAYPYKNRLGVPAADALNAAVATSFARVPQVRHVMARYTRQAILVLVVLNHPTSAVRNSVYEKELDLILEFPDVEFDFNLVPSLGREPEQIANDAGVIYSRVNYP